MKKCPTCEKTFEDSMRFCQVDGTPLVDEAPAFDPYATIVAQPTPVTEDESAEAAPAEVVEVEPAAPEPEAAPAEELHQTVGSIPIDAPEDVLDLPQVDPLKTMYVSDAEMQAALGTDEPDADIVELSPIEEAPDPEPPSFNEPDVPAPSFGDIAPPPSPFSASESVVEEPEPAPLAFDEPETKIQPEFSSPFEPAAAAPVAEWTPPPAPDASWQNQEIGANTPFQPPPAGVAGQNKTLAIISLVCGILGMTICCGSFAVSIAAIVTGFIARNKALQDPQEFGGAGLAMGGIITGALGIVLSIIFIILYFVGAIAGGLGNF